MQMAWANPSTDVLSETASAYMAARLAQMAPTQRLLAEGLMNDVISKGLRNLLTNATIVTDPTMQYTTSFPFSLSSAYQQPQTDTEPMNIVTGAAYQMDIPGPSHVYSQSNISAGSTDPAVVQYTTLEPYVPSCESNC